MWHKKTYGTEVVQQSHHVDDHLAEGVPLFLAEILENVTALFLQQFEAHSKVVVL